ncbi:MAG: DUF5058 family protein [Oscillospiraceae bacterium]|jgi:hypothetical protein|nr:DUF5058 family protein [Oscillospiraceae bacterium]
MPDFRESPFLYAISGLMALFVIAQSVFFARKAWRRAHEIGISSAQLKKTVLSSVLFTLAPALAILATVLVLGNSLGLPLPWLRLTVVGNINYEVTAAQSALESFGQAAGINEAVSDKAMFSAVAWVMTIGSVFPLVLMPFLVKRVQKKIGKTVEKNGRWADIIAAAAFIGIISAFLARAIAGLGDEKVPGDGAGLMSVATLISSVILTLILQKVSTIKGLSRLEPFALPIALFGALGVAMVLGQVLPAEYINLEWRY